MARVEKQAEKKPRVPQPGCARCRAGGAIVVLLCRSGHLPQEAACRCECGKGKDEYRGLVGIDRFTSGWGNLGAAVVEWPSVAERREYGLL